MTDTKETENKAEVATSNKLDEVSSQPELKINELDVLKERAVKLGITFNPTIGVEKLADKIDRKLNPEKYNKENANKVEATDTTETVTTAAIVIPKKNSYKPESKLEKTNRLRKDSARLIRVNISCMNPNKKEYEGEIFTVSNSVVGTFKKYIPFNTEDGYHIPNIIYKHLKERQCQVFYTVKGPKGNKVRKGKLIKEFAIEVLPNLTRDELKSLATKQAMANNLG